MASKTDSPASTSSSYTAEALKAKIAEAIKVVEPWLARAENTPYPSAVAYVDAVLGGLGIYNDAESHNILMTQCSTADLAQAFVGMGYPTLRAKRVACILRGEDENSVAAPAAQQVIVARLAQEDKPVAQWSDRQLVENLLPSHDQYDEIADTLDKRAQGRPFAVYADEAKGEIDTDTTLKMLGFAKKGRSPVNFRVGNCLKKLYRSVEPPNVMFVECPFHPGTLLVDGYCDECGQNWDGTAYEALQFARIVHEAGDAPEKAPDVKRFFKLAIEGGLDALRDEYEVAAMTYDEFALGGNLPNLRRRQSSGRAVSDPMNPTRRF